MSTPNTPKKDMAASKLSPLPSTEELFNMPRDKLQKLMLELGLEPSAPNKDSFLSGSPDIDYEQEVYDAAKQYESKA
ncbi:hypothetical protein McanCB56680_001050 [Microsporum canis]